MRPDQDAPVSHPIRVKDLSARQPATFDLRPDADACIAIAGQVGAERLRKLRFAGTLRPLGRRDWELEAELGATVVQPCVLTLDPVTTRIDQTVRRRYVADLPPVDATETEMPQDDTVEALGPVIDPAAVMIEALTLALPDFPRAADSGPVTRTAAPPGAEPIAEAGQSPFTELSVLRARMNDADDRR